MVEPYDERIAGHPEVAMSVMPDSNPGDVMADLVWVGAGTSDGDYKGKDVKGKFVLATGYGGSVHRLAVLKYGAKAVVCYLDDERAMEYPDMLAYTGMWPKPDELASTTFGFNLTNRQGEKLRSLLLSGSKVVLRGWVKGTGLEPYAMDVVVARIHGTDMAAVELVFARTSTIRRNRQTTTPAVLAAILDIARTLKGLIDEGASPVRNGPSGSLGPRMVRHDGLHRRPPGVDRTRPWRNGAREYEPGHGWRKHRTAPFKLILTRPRSPSLRERRGGEPGPGRGPPDVRTPRGSSRRSITGWCPTRAEATI